MEQINAIKTPIYLVSACLVGLLTRYDGEIRKNDACLAELVNGIWIPFCPEQLGGLPTPRPASDLTGGDGADVLAGRASVVCRDGTDITAQFVRGAQQVLALGRAQSVTTILLKSGSPSCGISPQLGVTAALLKQAGFALREF